MKKYAIEPTRMTPEVRFDPIEGILELKGRSCPHSAIEFYHPIIQGIEAFSKTNASSFTAIFSLNYFNPSSSKCLFDIFKKLLAIKEEGKRIRIEWCYEINDEDMMEAGEDYAAIMGLEFQFLALKEY